MESPRPIEPLPEGCRLTVCTTTPVCLACVRHHFGMDIDLPAPPMDALMEECPFCGRPTNHGLYLEIDKVSLSQQSDGGDGNPPDAVRDGSPKG